jgi:chemotaxis protein CheX
MEMRESVQRGELRLENGPYHTDDATVIISMVGAVDGSVFYSMSKESAIQFASALMGETFEVLNVLAQSGIAELGNVITGQASMRLAEAGFESNISTPSLIIGKGASISTLEYPRLVVPLDNEDRFIDDPSVSSGKYSGYFKNAPNWNTGSVCIP